MTTTAQFHASLGDSPKAADYAAEIIRLQVLLNRKPHSLKTLTGYAKGKLIGMLDELREIAPSDDIAARFEYEPAPLDSERDTQWILRDDEAFVIHAFPQSFMLREHRADEVLDHKATVTLAEAMSLAIELAARVTPTQERAPVEVTPPKKEKKTKTKTDDAMNTTAAIARSLEVDPRVARQRIRAAIARGDLAEAAVKHTWDQGSIPAVSAIIKGKAR